MTGSKNKKCQTFIPVTEDTSGYEDILFVISFNSSSVVITEMTAELASPIKGTHIYTCPLKNVFLCSLKEERICKSELSQHTGLKGCKCFNG